MGQLQDCQNLQECNGSRRAQGQTLGRYVAALVVCGLAALACSEAAKPAPPPPQATPNPPAAVQFDGDKAWAHLIKQCDFGPRVPDTDAHAKCQKYILDEMKKSCDDAHEQPFEYNWKFGHKLLKMANLIGTQNWKDAKVRLVLLTHWDSRPEADQDPDPANKSKPILGANDGASGVAVLLELMRSVKDRLPKDIGVMYFMTDGEDVGPDSAEMYLGVKKFVRSMPSPKPDYGILLDMIGDKDLAVPMEPNSLQAAPEIMRAFYQHATDIGLRSTFPPTEGPAIEDDHLVFIDAKIPTIDLIDFDFAPWHTIGDVPSTCSAESLKKIGTAMETWVMKDPPFVPHK